MFHRPTSLSKSLLALDRENSLSEQGFLPTCLMLLQTMIHIQYYMTRESSFGPKSSIRNSFAHAGYPFQADI